MDNGRKSKEFDFGPGKVNQLLSDGYGIEAVMRDLFVYRKPSCQSFIVSFLQRYDHEQIEFFLPQLVHLSIVCPSYSAYSNLFHELAVNDHNIGMQIFWLLGTYLGQPRFGGVNKFIVKLEASMINGISASTNGEVISLYKIDDVEDDVFFRKLVREEYFDVQKKFVDKLIRTSIELCEIDENINHYLSDALLELSGSMEKLRKKYGDPKYNNYTARLYRGFVFPFNFSNYTEQIVRFLPLESYCIRTSARVPYLLMVETIDLNEVSRISQNFEVRFNRVGSFSSSSKQFKKNYSLPLVSIFKDETWEEKLERLRRASPFGYYESWTIRGIIVKSSDDLRQEQLAMQIIKKAVEVFKKENLNLYLRPYKIIVTGYRSGLIEYIPDTMSIHNLKKNYEMFESLKEIFKHVWNSNFDEAQINFVQSMAGYSLICYILNLKDRHNGNILIDSIGHVIHIDFGFFLTSSPGGNLGFESAPFKLTMEMIELMGGYKSEMYVYFAMLVSKGFLALRKYFDDFCLLIEIMEIESDFECFVDKENAIKEFRERFWLGLEDNECLDKVMGLIVDAADNWRTNQYDLYQKGANSIRS